MDANNTLRPFLQPWDEPSGKWINSAVFLDVVGRVPTFLLGIEFQAATVYSVIKYFLTETLDMTLGPG
jgi:hypothetical protein